MEIKTTKLRAVFDPGTNNFSVLQNLVTGDNYIKTAPAGPVITLYSIQKGKRIELLPGAPDIVKRGNTLDIQYREFHCKPAGAVFRVNALLKVKAEDDRLILSVSVENPDEPEITEILSPRLGGIVLGTDYRDDIIIFPHHAGEKTINPVRGYGYDKKDFCRAGSVRYENFFRREINYCGLASMSWMYYYDGQNGLYFGSHDPRFPVTGIIAETSGDAENPWMGFAFRKYHRICKGEKYDAGEYIIAVSDRDWHYGSELYRSYIAPYLDFSHNPDFLSDECALNQCYNFKRINKIDNYFRDIPRLYEEGKKWGVRHIFIAAWNRTGFDSSYPEYYPDMELGSAMEFRRGLEYVRKNGGFSTLYINARIFDVKSDFHSSLGEKMAIRNEYGNMIHEVYGPARFTVNCPSDKLWRDYLIDTAEFAMKAYGCDGIYLDQLASAEPFPCYSREHSHENIEEFNHGNVHILKELLRRLREYNPDAYLMTENCGDIYGSFTWGNLTWNGARYDEFYNVFKYTFPEFVQVNMVNPRGWEDDEEQRYQWFFRDIQRAVLLGSVLWMGITTRLTAEAAQYHEYAKRVLSFRRHIQPFIKQARFLDDLYVGRISECCRATCWELKDGRRMLLAGNSEENTAGVVETMIPHHTKEIRCYDLDWRPVPLKAAERAAEEEEAAAEEEKRDPLRLDLAPRSMICMIFE